MKDKPHPSRNIISKVIITIKDLLSIKKLIDVTIKHYKPRNYNALQFVKNRIRKTKLIESPLSRLKDCYIEKNN